MFVSFPRLGCERRRTGPAGFGETRPFVTVPREFVPRSTRGSVPRTGPEQEQARSLNRSWMSTFLVESNATSSAGALRFLLKSIRGGSESIKMEGTNLTEGFAPGKVERKEEVANDLSSRRCILLERCVHENRRPAVCSMRTRSIMRTKNVAAEGRVPHGGNRVTLQNLLDSARSPRGEKSRY